MSDINRLVEESFINKVKDSVQDAGDKVTHALAKSYANTVHPIAGKLVDFGKFEDNVAKHTGRGIRDGFQKVADLATDNPRTAGVLALGSAAVGSGLAAKKLVEKFKKKK